MGDLSEHFSKQELCCKCSECGGLCLVSPRLVNALEKLRALGPEPVVIHDAYRCEAHNRKVNGVPNSTHMTGEAADLHIKDCTLQQMYDRAMKVPEFAEGGIGVYSEEFIHVDVRNYKARWARKDKVYLALDTLVEVEA